MHDLLGTLLTQPTVQQCAVHIGTDMIQRLAEVPVNRWGRYFNLHDLLARPQLQLGFEWQTNSKEILAYWQSPLQEFCADKLHTLTLAELCRGYQGIFPLDKLVESPASGNAVLMVPMYLENRLSMTTIDDYFYWDNLCTVLTKDLQTILVQNRFQQWMQYETELLILSVSTQPDKLLPKACRVVLINHAMDAVFTIASNYGTELLDKMQLSTLAETQLKQMDNAQLEQIVRGFAGHYLVHIQNRGWLGAVFALPGMLLYLI